jgi:hypothetical protein
MTDHLPAGYSSRAAFELDLDKLSIALAELALSWWRLHHGTQDMSDSVSALLVRLELGRQALEQRRTMEAHAEHLLERLILRAAARRASHTAASSSDAAEAITQREHVTS